MIFESKAEELAYPILKQFCDEYRYKLDYQVQVIECVKSESGWRDWVHEKYPYGPPEWLEDIHDSCEVDKPCVHKYFKRGHEFERYRIDFVISFLDVISSIKRNIGVEIDGEEYHTRSNDKERDEYLEDHGYVVVRIDAKDIFYNPEKIVKRLKEVIIKNGG